jgi:hypothetical protein
MVQDERRQLMEEGERRRLADEVVNFVAATEHPKAMLETLFQDARQHLAGLHSEAAKFCRILGDWHPNLLTRSDEKLPQTM